MALDLYRSNYRPSARHPMPQATICVWALAVETEAEARRLLKTREFWRISFDAWASSASGCSSARSSSSPGPT